MQIVFMYLELPMVIVILSERSLSPEPARESEESHKLQLAVDSGILRLRFTEPQNDIFLSISKLALVIILTKSRWQQRSKPYNSER